MPPIIISVTFIIIIIITVSIYVINVIAIIIIILLIIFLLLLLLLLLSLLLLSLVAVVAAVVLVVVAVAGNAACGRPTRGPREERVCATHGFRGQGIGFGPPLVSSGVHAEGLMSAWAAGHSGCVDSDAREEAPNKYNRSLYSNLILQLGFSSSNLIIC